MPPKGITRSILVPKNRLSTRHQVAANNLLASEDEDELLGSDDSSDLDYKSDSFDQLESDEDGDGSEQVTDEDEPSSSKPSNGIPTSPSADVHGLNADTFLAHAETRNELDEDEVTPNLSALERRLHDKTMETIRQQHQQNLETFDHYGEQTGDVQLKRRRIAAINTNMLDATTGKTKPASTPGEQRLRNLITAPFDDVDEERIQEDDDTGLFLTSVPIPGRERREIDLRYPVDESETSCYGCSAGLFADANPTDDALKTVIDIYRRNRGICLSEPLAERMSEAYQKIRQAHNENVDRHREWHAHQGDIEAKKLPAWSTRMIYDHITQHMITNPEVFVHQTMRHLHEMNEVLLNNGIYRMDAKRPGRCFLHKNTAKMYLANVNTQLRLLSSSTKRMNGYTANMAPVSTSNVISSARTSTVQDRLQNVFDIGE